MEIKREELLQMIEGYKKRLADADEQNILYQVIINKQTKEIEELNGVIEMLQKVSGQVEELKAKIEKMESENEEVEVVEPEIITPENDDLNCHSSSWIVQQ